MIALVVLLAAAHAAPSPFGVPTRWLDALLRAEVTSADRQMIHASHTCSLLVDGALLPVLDVREVLAHMPAPRGVNHIVVLSPAGKVVRAIGYADERPMRCDGPRLLVWRSLAVDNLRPEGNVLVFSAGGTVVTTEEVALQEFGWEGEGARR